MPAAIYQQADGLETVKWMFRSLDLHTISFAMSSLAFSEIGNETVPSFKLVIW
jgi:hypothetical protein